MNVVLLLLLAGPTATPTPTPSPIVVLRNAPGPRAPVQGESLAEVARRIKLRLPTDKPRVLTNESVKQLSEGVELTTARPFEGKPQPAGGTAALPDEKQAYWQRKYQEARAAIARWEAEVKRLEGEVNRLEREFYARDDPAYRDGVIKPAWDRALVDLRNARKQLEDSRLRPDQVLDEARRDGALPGWFRGLPEPAPGEAAETETPQFRGVAVPTPTAVPPPTRVPRPSERPNPS